MKNINVHTRTENPNVPYINLLCWPLLFLAIKCWMGPYSNLLDLSLGDLLWSLDFKDKLLKFKLPICYLYF